MTLDFALEICTKNASGTKTGDSVPLGNVLNNLLIITWQSITTLPSPITEIILCLPALSLNVRHRQSAGVKSVLHRKHQQRAPKKQWKHITGFPKYMTVNLKTRLLSCTPQNTPHSTDTFLNNDVNALIYRVVWVCLTLCVCVVSKPQFQQRIGWQVCAADWSWWCFKSASAPVNRMPHSEEFSSTVFKKAVYKTTQALILTP